MDQLNLQEVRLYEEWVWQDYEVSEFDCEELNRLKEEIPSTAEWLTKLPEIQTNYISVRTIGGKNVLFGSLLYSIKKNLDDEQQSHQFYFYVDPSHLITVNIDKHTREALLADERKRMFEEAEDAVSGMFIVARALLHYFHIGLDKFEINLRSLEESMEKRNARTLMDKILSARFELLFWSNQFISFQELLHASNEAFHFLSIEERTTYKQLTYRMKRMDSLFRHYEDEIDTLISIDNAASSIRGNDIMKTLTIVTAVFTPATAVGAIWGMNFENLPWIKTPWGFTVVTAAILISMAGMYIWMFMKGWTGDILKIKPRGEKPSNTKNPS
ncbi:magnesium transporter CorA family protein [Paenibacillus urinalis]|uniref:Magnesium transporter CorA family protein n=1 Tax=Paenibacillus urinalis TaxID=521520 RepID=A0AAX3MY96_9BACL|nr:magnesium transporter CorA family protein [Paenibacillus urinalis]WDH82028.1 magnesium transporter CorA family protein [Paenibacillus urinalis]